MGGKKEVWQRAQVFLGITFGGAWLCYATAWGCGQRYGSAGFDMVMVIASVMPAVAMLVCRKGEEGGAGFDPEAWGVSPHFKGTVPTYLLGYGLPALLAALTALMYFAAFPGQYDPTGQSTIDAFVQAGMAQEQAASAISSMLGMGVLAGPFANILLALTELLGFLGYLLPKALLLFEKKPGLKAALSVSAVWAVWHGPLFFDGYFYGTGYPGAPFVGLLLGMVFYFLLGFLLCYMALRTGSILPACLTRSGVTAMAAAAVYFCRGESLLLVGPGLYGAFGCLALLLFCGLYLLRLMRMERSKKLWYQRGPKEKKKLPGKAGADGRR